MDCLASPHLVLPLKYVFFLLLEDIPLSPHFAQYCLFLDRGQLVVFTDLEKYLIQVMPYEAWQTAPLRSSELFALEVPLMWAVYMSLGCGRADYTGCPDRQVWTPNWLGPCLLQRLSAYGGENLVFTQLPDWPEGVEAGTSLLVGSAGSLCG